MPNLFSPITSKIFGGLSIALALGLVALLLTKNAVINSQTNQINGLISQNSSLRSDLATCRGNTATLEAQLKGQSDKVQAVADAANLVAKAGVNAVAQAQKAGAGVAKQVGRINALPEASCADVNDILLQGAK